MAALPQNDQMDDAIDDTRDVDPQETQEWQGDTVQWTVDAVANGEVPVFAVYTRENNPIIAVAIVGGAGGVLSASALLNGSPAGTLTLTSSGW